MTAVEPFGNVAPEYRHVEKRITPGPGVDLPGARLKWYDIARAEAPVPAAIESLARVGLAEAVESGSLAFSSDLGFVILHRCGQSFYFLLICTWRGNNELWETVWAKNGEADPAFHPWPSDGPHRPTYCVWELGAVWHEQGAWSRFLSSARDAAALEAYLADEFEGDV